eukprot:NODE_117_length_18329_cov_0.420954.p10 type:complete len:114 gc:universal NODE_117_length_18329_cov_0.420954:9179-9520(+)
MKFFNLIGRSGITPDMFRCSLIVPIQKGKSNEYQHLVEYRPIALCSVFMKMFEKLLKSQIMPFLETSPNQFGCKRATTLTDAAWYLENRLSEMKYNSNDFIMIKRTWHRPLIN